MKQDKKIKICGSQEVGTCDFCRAETGVMRKYLYAKNIHALNYLYDFDIFKTCNCYIKYGGCPDKCHRKKYVNKYVKELFTNEDYLASIRNKQINANNLQWD